MNESNEKPKRRWQNLLHKKCPNCDSRFVDKGLYFICPTASSADATKSCFFIKKENAVALLLDTNHPANFCLSAKDRANIADVVKEFGILA